MIGAVREPAALAAALERSGPVVDGRGERYTGYAVLGVAFRSGDVLALRRFPRSAPGAPYTSVWHCDPEGHWTFYSDIADQGCAEYFAPVLDRVVIAPIRIEWRGPRRLSIAVDGGRVLRWSLALTPTIVTRLYNGIAPRLAPALLRYPRLLPVTAHLARAALRTGPLRLAGRMPSGAPFISTPWALWSVQSSRACIGGYDPGDVAPLTRPLALGGFHIPRRPLFAATHLVMVR